MIVFEYFFDKMEVFELKINERAEKNDLEMEDIEQLCLTHSLHLISFLLLIHSFIFQAFLPSTLRKLNLPFPDTITRSLLLAISVCYHVRVQDRVDYEEEVTAQFVAPLGLPGGQHNLGKKSYGTQLPGSAAAWTVCP